MSAQSLEVNSNACAFPNCSLPLRGGIRIYSNVSEGVLHACTAGWFVRDHNNYPYLLTAGHCFYPESGAWFTGGWNAENPGGGFECQIGGRVASRLDAGADAGVITTTQCEPPKPLRDIVFWSVSEEEIAAESPRTAYVGLYECHVGEHSETRCGNVESANVTTSINYTAEGKGVIALTHTDWFCALNQPGDSGGPVFTYSGRTATGTGIDVAASGEAECGQGGHGIAFELSYALEAIGVHLAAS